MVIGAKVPAMGHAEFPDSNQLRAVLQRSWPMTFSPILLARFLDAVPALNTWLLGLGALLSISVLYHGIRLVLRPDQTKGFGIYLVSAIIVILSAWFPISLPSPFFTGRHGSSAPSG